MIARLKETLTYWGYNTAWTVIRLLPEEFTYHLAYRSADRLTRKSGTGVTRLHNNYARVRPELSKAELDELVRLGMRSYLRYWVDTFRSPFWSQARTLDTVVVEHEDYL